MRRVDLVPRPNWQEACESVGFGFHSIDGVYWDETHAFEFTAAQIDELEAATEELHRLSLLAVDRIIAENLFERLAIAPEWADHIRESWKRRDPALFGRLDLAYDGKSPPRLLEYNADTPTALLEASVVQWHWLQDVKPGADQFNSLHEKLIANWRALSMQWSVRTPVHFSCVKDNDEDFGNVEYMRDVATQAGIDARFVFVEDIGWAGGERCFVDGDNDEILVLFKLYPWEWIMADEFGRNLPGCPIQVIEPAWKILLSNKGLLPILWDIAPNHPNLLQATFDRFRITGDFVQKPIYSREGANVTIYRGAEVLRQGGTYGAEGYVYQRFAPIPEWSGGYVTVGSWIVGDQAAGIGLREDDSPITRNTSRFVPHFFN